MKNKYGFTEKENQEILDIIQKYCDIEEALLFGSRAMKTFKVMSDVDVVLYGQNINYSTISSVQSDFEESSLPYMFDILDFNKITSEELKEHIKKYGKCLYKKETVFK